EGATPKSMSATHAGSTSGGNLCHLLVRRARNLAMSKSVAPIVVMRLPSIVAHGARGGEDQPSYHPVTLLPPHHEFESQYAAPRRRPPLFGGRKRHRRSSLRRASLHRFSLHRWRSRARYAQGREESLMSEPALTTLPFARSTHCRRYEGRVAIVTGA